MSREIKFRFFDNEKKRMYYSDSQNDAKDLGAKLGQSCIATFFNNFYGLDLMQYTGLIHQKTKKEIYEGDVFREEKEKDYGDEREYSVVMWIPQRAAFYLIPTVHYQVLQDNDLEDEFDFEWLFEDALLRDFSIDVGLDLVGNIHENPELLEV